MAYAYVAGVDEEEKVQVEPDAPTDETVYSNAPFWNIDHSDDVFPEFEEDNS